MLKRHEGVKRKPYRCTKNKLTIGCGRNIEDNGLRPEEIDFMLQNDIGDISHFLFINYPWFAVLDPVRQAALVDMAFCLGATKYQKFRKMNHALSQQRYLKAADELLDSRFAIQTGSRALELAQMIRTGKWIDD